MPKGFTTHYLISDAATGTKNEAQLRKGDVLENTDKRKVTVNRPLCQCLSRIGATIKQHISTLAIHPLIVMPKHVLVPHRAHNFIVNTQPSFPTTAISLRMKHIDRIMPAACGLAVVVEYSMELVMR
jgi:hypothetical protein